MWLVDIFLVLPYLLFDWLIDLAIFAAGRRRVPRVLSSHELEILALIATDGEMPVAPDSRFPYLKLRPSHVALGFGNSSDLIEQGRAYRMALRDLIVRRYVRSRRRTRGRKVYVLTRRGRESLEGAQREKR